jgi:hypothetical protein
VLYDIQLQSSGIACISFGVALFSSLLCIISRPYFRLMPRFLDNGLTDCGEFFSLTRRPPFTPTKITGTHFCWRLSRPLGHTTAGRIRSNEKSNYLIGNRTRDHPACSIVPQPATLQRAPSFIQASVKMYTFNGSL